MSAALSGGLVFASWDLRLELFLLAWAARCSGAGKFGDLESDASSNRGDAASESDGQVPSGACGGAAQGGKSGGAVGQFDDL
jgi:hypothetical protein